MSEKPNIVAVAKQLLSRFKSIEQMRRLATSYVIDDSTLGSDANLSVAVCLEDLEDLWEMVYGPPKENDTNILYSSYNYPWGNLFRYELDKNGIIRGVPHE